MNKNKLRLFSLILLVGLLLSCQGQKVWRLERARFWELLAGEDLSFLHEIDYHSVRLEEAERLYPGGTYYMGLLYGSLGRPEVETALMEASIRVSPSPWREEALTYWLERQVYWNYGRSLDEGLSWVELDEGIEWLSFLRPVSRQFYEACSSQRRGDPGWTGEMAALFRDYEDKNALERAWFYMESRHLLEELSSAERDLVTARIELFKGNEAEALDLWLSLLAEESDLRVSSLFRALRLAAASQGAAVQERAAGVLESWAPELSGEPQVTAWENAGRLYRSASQTEKAATAFRQAWKKASSLATETDSDERTDKDVSLWFYLDSLMTLRPARGISEIEKTVSLWDDPEWYDDLISSACRYYVVSNNFQGLARFYGAVRTGSSLDARTQMAWILWRLGEFQGRLEEDLFSSLLPLVAQDLSAPGEGVRPNYYRLMAGAFCTLQQGESWNPGTMIDGIKQSEGKESATEGEPSAQRLLEEGYLKFGLEKVYHQRIIETRQADGETARELVALLSDDGDYYSSVRLMALLFTLPDFHPRREDWEALYPRPERYREWVETLCTQEKVPPALVYALLRQESLFHETIVSYAGAVGLAQIMPTTGTWLMERFKIPGAMDLRDPQLNLTLGIRYLKDLMVRMGSTPEALMAYNAGSGRVRRWQRQYGHYPVDLLVEAVPLDQPQGYVRHILASTVVYGYLYQGFPVEEALDLLYPREAF